MNVQWGSTLFSRAWRWMFLALILIVLLDYFAARQLGITLYAKNWNEPVQTIFACELIIFVLFMLPKTGLYQELSTQKIFLRISLFFQAFVYLFVLSLAVAVLIYLSVLLKSPLVDMQLAQFDAFLGFDWLALYNWIGMHESFGRLLLMAYNSMAVQGAIVILVTAGCAPEGQLEEFVFLYLSSIVIVVLVACFFPAEGAFFHYGKATAPGAISVSDFRILRAGLASRIDIGHLQGLVSIPSFHACMAIMFSYALRSSKILFPFALIVNGMVLLSALYCGGHYLSDLLAAGFLMLVLIVCSRRFGFFTLSR